MPILESIHQGEKGLEGITESNKTVLLGLPTLNVEIWELSAGKKPEEALYKKARDSGEVYYQFDRVHQGGVNPCPVCALAYNTYNLR
jgi:hypothetical protein